MNDVTASVRLLASLLRVFDLAAMAALFVVAAILASPALNFSVLSDFLTLRLRADNVLIFAAMTGLWALLLNVHRVYADLGSRALVRNLLMLTRAVTIGTGLLWLLAIVFDLQMVDYRFIGIFWIANLLVVTAARLLAALWVHYLSHKEKNRIDFLVVGMNRRSQELVRSLQKAQNAQRRFLGYVDVDAKQRTAIFEQQDASGDYLADLRDLPDILRTKPVDEVVVCLPLKSYYDEVSEIISLCEEQGITVRVLADFFQSRLTHSQVGQFGNQALITVATHNIRGASAVMKRSLDVAVSGSLLILLSPFLLVTGLLVALTSPGPALFTQQRVGMNKKSFRMIKFRTMVADAEVRQAALESMNEAQGPAFKIHNDPRITPVGSVLRKTSIDELPQLINVFKGEMSLVGPRPLPLRDYAGFKQDWHRRRLSVRPGITGLWQVKDRNHKSFDRWMQLDMQYIDEWSFGLDLKILLQTIPAVLRGSGE